MGSGVWAGVFDAGGDRGADATRTACGRRRRWTASATAAPSRRRRSPPTPISSCISSRGRSWSARHKQIGIVTGGQAQVWYDAVVTGQDSHAGTTPPSARRDALVGAARIIDLVDRMMRARGEDGRGTVGQLFVSPNSRNVIPGEVRFSVEFRHPDEAEIERSTAQFPREAGFDRAATAESSWR